ncbi:hypothetical protein NtRootA9_33080 [Arthrobacter sp. NtRootA9]|nr:hypothetical protein NtRootA9_33080 [Arthrobacter sp. NtRootA9]
MPVHGADHVQRAHQVVVVVLQRLLHRLAHGFEPGKMDDGIDAGAGEDILDGGFVDQVNVVELRGLAAEFSHATQ